MPNKKNPMEVRLAIIDALTKGCKGPVIEKVIHFTNDDVPEFLKRLDRWEKRSRKVSLLIQTPCI